MSVDEDIQKGLEAHYDLKEHRDYLEKKMQVDLLNLIVLSEYLGYPTKELQESLQWESLKEAGQTLIFNGEQT